MPPFSGRLTDAQGMPYGQIMSVSVAYEAKLLYLFGAPAGADLSAIAQVRWP